MKHLNYLFIVLLLSLVSMPMYAVMENVEDHFFCGFDSQEEFDQWTIVDLNGTAGSNSKFYWDAGTGAAHIGTSWSKGTDDWIFTPAITLSGTKKYALKVNFYSYEDQIKFTMGSAPTVEAQTTILAEDYVYDGHRYLLLALPENTPAGTYYFGAHTSSPGEWKGDFSIYSFELTENKAYNLEVTVKNKATQELMKNVEVTLKGTEGTFYEDMWYGGTGGDTYVYENLNAGKYTVTAELKNFKSIENQEVTVGEGENTLSLEMEAIPVSTVTGKVVDEEGAPISGAAISLVCAKEFKGETNNEGVFTIADVHQSETASYLLTIKKENKFSYKAEVKVNSETTDLQTITLKDYIGTPINLSTDMTEKGMFLSWMMPLGEKDFANDNGEYAGRYQMNNKGGYSSVGVSFKEPMTLSSMSWLVADIEDNLIDVYVYAYRKDGSVAETPVYEKKQVSTINYSSEDGLIWNNHIFPETILAPYGCIVAIGHAESVTVCSDYQRNSWNSMISVGKGWGSADISVSNFMIRANGETLSNDLSKKVSMRMASTYSEPVVRKAGSQDFTFTVWRLAGQDKENQEAWKELGKDLSNLYLIDTEYNSLPAGDYFYAVQSNYASGKQSSVTFSNLVEHEQYTTVTVNLYANTAINFDKGATVTLMNLNDDRYNYTATSKGGAVVFENVHKGKYIVKASKEGFQNIQTGEQSFESDNAYKINLDLVLQPIAPFNLTAEQAEESTDVTLNWNKTVSFFDDFEDMEDFSLNPAGNLGWTYADVDGQTTFGIKLCQNTPYPNMHEPMAFMAFNPSATTPNLVEYIKPYSGNKVLVSASAEVGASDDYMFSQELNFDRDFTLSFYACSGFYAIYGNEEFMVGYTTGEAKPENVIWLTEGTEKASALWTKYTYTMPKDARHTVIRCVSNQCLFFMVDDVFIGENEPEIFTIATYNVVLDGENVGTTTEKNITLTNLDEGKHIAKVQSAFTMGDMSKQYSDFTELVFDVKEPVGINQKAIEVLYTYNAETGVITLGNQAEKVELYNVQGKLCASCVAGETIDTNAFQAGVYVLRIQAAGETSFGKILVK